MKSLIIFAALIVICSARGARVWKGQCIERFERVFSDKNCFNMQIQNDGNMVIRRSSDGKAVWATVTDNRGGHRACMERKKNLFVNF